MPELTDGDDTSTDPGATAPGDAQSTSDAQSASEEQADAGAVDDAGRVGADDSGTDDHVGSDDPAPAEAPAIRVFAGECTTEFEGKRDRTQRGRVVVVVKPDRTTLVHDADGYQPVAWLTRPDSLTVEAGPDAPGGTTSAGSGSTDADAESDAGFGIVARTAEETLRVTCHDEAGRANFPVSPAGVPVGQCPACDGVLVRSRDVVCVDCRARYPLPSGATVADGNCDDCGLPLLRVERGRAFEVCLDPGCEALADAVTEAFDRVWDCPDCGSDLRVKRARGRVFLGCDDYPDCETTFSVPAGVVVGHCDCGLPVFETASGRRCVDGSCDRDWERRADRRRGDDASVGS